MKTYTIIAGADDVGKRVYLNLMQAKPNSLGLVFCDLTSVYLVAKNPVQCMEKGYNFTVETTLLSDEAILLAKMAKEKGYEVHLHFIGIDDRFGLLSEECKNVKLERFYKQTENLLKLLPCCDCGVFVDNREDFRYLAKYKNNNITFNEEQLPGWLEYIKKEFQNL
ncbi:MAG: zeta toxin family protein [Oscillospiraceae bacterium]|nr:zeta toxin family protein [Oscillospiraceae bacterium]